MNQKYSENIASELTQDLLQNQVKAHHSIKKAHSNSIQSIAVHPSNDNFASGSHDKTIKLWDVVSLKEKATYSDHKQGVWSLDFAHDGKFLVSASPDKSVLIWDTKKPSASQKLLGHQDKVYSAKISPDDKLIASIGEGGQLLLWDINKANQPIKRLDLKSFVGYDISWSNDGNYLFVTTLGGKTNAIDSKTFNVIDQASFHVDFYVKTQSVCTNWKTLPNRVFSSCDNGLIAKYNFSNHKLEKQFEFVAHIGAGCRKIKLHPELNYMLSSGKDGSVRLWNCQTQGKPKMLANLTYHNENVTSPQFIGTKLVVTGSWDQDIGVWNFKDLIPNKI